MVYNNSLFNLQEKIYMFKSQMNDNHNIASMNTFETPRAGLIPIVIEEVRGGERSYDLYSRLLKERIIFLHGEVEDMMADSICAQMLFLAKEDKEKPIYLYINSPGGSVTAGMAIYDTMNAVQAPVHTVCMGQAASMGAFLLCSGDVRSALPSARIMIHQPLGGARGQATDIEIQAKEILRMKKELTQIIADNSNHSYEKVRHDCERDFFMSAQETLDYGLIDKIETGIKDKSKFPRFVKKAEKEKEKEKAKPKDTKSK